VKPTDQNSGVGETNRCENIGGLHPPYYIND
jgi:hypothetical protein